jgi:Tol biopolymer transport system component
MQRSIWFIAGLVMACDKRAPMTNTESTISREGSEPKSQASTAAALASELSSAPTVPGPTLDCSEFGPDTPIVDEPPGPGVPRMARAGSKDLPNEFIAYESEGAIWVMSDAGQRRRRLASGKAPQWFPGGRSLLFVAEFGDHLPRLCEAHVDCSSTRVLSRPLFTSTAGSASPQNPYEDGIFSYSVSPDAKHVAFARHEQDQENLYVLELASHAERLLADHVSLAEPAWFPDGKALAYVSARSEPSELMRLELASGQARKICELQNGFVAVAPDSRLIFHSALGGSFTIEHRQYRLYQTDIARGAVYSLAGSELGPGAYGEVRISPNGARLAVPWSLWTGNGPAALRDHGIATFSLPAKLPPTSARAAAPLAPRAAFDSKTSAILFTQPRTRNVAQSASGERYAINAPSWAKDSRHLVFGLEYRGRDSMDSRSQIVAVDSDAPRPQLVFLANGSNPVWAK